MASEAEIEAVALEIWIEFGWKGTRDELLALSRQFLEAAERVRDACNKGIGTMTDTDALLARMAEALRIANFHNGRISRHGDTVSRDLAGVVIRYTEDALAAYDAHVREQSAVAAEATRRLM